VDPRPEAGAGQAAASLTGPARDAWEALLARYRPIAVQLARGIVRRAELAEDVVQESACAVLAQAAARGARFESPTHARNYFLRAVHNRAVNALRDPARAHEPVREETLAARPVEPDVLARHGPVPGAAPPAGEEPEPLQRLQHVLRALAGLRASEREAVRLRYLEGLSYREISERTGASISTLHSRVEAALERIRARIGKERLHP
jgi:RNA polymerase sigma-70 factor (ECF subfamily)